MDNGVEQWRVGMWHASAVGAVGDVWHSTGIRMCLRMWHVEARAGHGARGPGPVAAHALASTADFSFLAFLLGRFREQPRARARRCAVLFTCVSIFETIYTLLKLKKGQKARQKAIRDTRYTVHPGSRLIELVEHGCSGSGSNPGREPGGRGRRVRERESARTRTSKL